MLKEAIYKARPDLLTHRDAEVLDDLIKAAERAWDQLSDDLLNRLSETMPHRVRAVLDAEGWYTKY